MLYVDTSVLVACYCPEPLSRAAEAAVAKSDGPVLTRLVEIEFCSALAAKVRVRELGPATANRIVSLFRQHLDDARYAAVPITDREYTIARDWIARFSVPLRAPDALHLAVAFSNDLALLTADRDLARAAAQFGVKCTLIR